LYGDVTPVEDESVHEWMVYCMDTETGEMLWEKVAHTGVPGQKRHPMSSHASASMTTNGEFAVAFFGSEGLYCYNMEGELQLGSTCMVTPAIKKGQIFFRTVEGVMAVGN
jgi:hypothetical protein